jgi:uncharacterized phage-associated protein
MSKAVEDRFKARQSVLLLMRLAKDRDIEVNRTKLAKLLYLADLRAAEIDGVIPSGFVWRWRSFGPHTSLLTEIENELVKDQSVGRIQDLTAMGSPTTRYFAGHTAPNPDVPDEFVRHLTFVLDKWGKKSATELRDMTYTTRPMRRAVEGGVHEVELEMIPESPRVDLTEIMTHFAGIPAIETHGEVQIDNSRAAELLDDFRENRARATQFLIG